jgi:hypothetical protein
LRRQRAADIAKFLCVWDGLLTRHAYDIHRKLTLKLLTGVAFWNIPVMAT